MKVDRRIRRFACAAVLGAVLAIAGCGVLTARKTSFATALRTADGRTIYIEDVRAIVDDQTRTDGDKVVALEELGIEDGDLILVLLTLPPADSAG